MNLTTTVKHNHLWNCKECISSYSQYQTQRVFLHCHYSNIITNNNTAHIHILLSCYHGNQICLTQYSEKSIFIPMIVDSRSLNSLPNKDKTRYSFFWRAVLFFNSFLVYLLTLTCRAMFA